MDTAAVDTIDEQDPPPPVTNDGLTDTVRLMRDELAAHYKGANPVSVRKAMADMRPVSDTPKSWDSNDLAGKAVKAYRADIGVPAKPVPEKKAAVRPASPKPRRPVVQPTPAPEVRPVVQPAAVPQPAVVHPALVPQPQPPVRTARRKPVVVWPVVILAQPAFVAVWSGWVGLGGLTGFGVVHPLPGIWDSLKLNTAITLPVGVETYGSYALYVWLSNRVPPRARKFAMWSAFASLIVGAGGQVAYHLLAASGITVAPWWITTAVSVLPVAVLGMGAALAHLVREES